jgi:hypothetical protein
MYITCTTRVQHLSHMGWIPHPCCTCDVRESPIFFLVTDDFNKYIYIYITCVRVSKL